MRNPTNISTHHFQSFILSTLFIAALPISSALAFDCKAASTKAEKAICADSNALSADSDLGKAYETLRSTLDAGQRGELGKAQSRWLKTRDSNCDTKGDEESPKCLADESIKRAKFLMGVPESGPGGTGKLVPFFQIEKGEPGRTDVDVEVFKFANPATPAEKAFNDDIEKLISDIAQPDKGDTSQDYSFSANTTLTYVSPRLISAQTATSTFNGGAHPMNQSTSSNIDVAAGSEATFANMLDKKAAQQVFDSCAKQVLKQKKVVEGADADLSTEAIKNLNETVASVSGDLALWNFYADKAVITYDQDVVGAHAEGVFDCTIPYTQLRRLVKPGFPLP